MSDGQGLNESLSAFEQDLFERWNDPERRERFLALKASAQASPSNSEGSPGTKTNGDGVESSSRSTSSSSISSSIRETTDSFDSISNNDNTRGSVRNPGEPTVPPQQAQHRQAMGSYETPLRQPASNAEIQVAQDEYTRVTGHAIVSEKQRVYFAVRYNRHRERFMRLVRERWEATGTPNDLLDWVGRQPVDSTAGSATPSDAQVVDVVQASRSLDLRSVHPLAPGGDAEAGFVDGFDGYWLDVRNHHGPGGSPDELWA